MIVLSLTIDGKSAGALVITRCPNGDLAGELTSASGKRTEKRAWLKGFGPDYEKSANIWNTARFMLDRMFFSMGASLELLEGPREHRILALRSIIYWVRWCRANLDPTDNQRLDAEAALMLTGGAVHYDGGHI